MKIGFTGTRNGMTPQQRAALESMLCDAEGEFHHGDCVGADAQAHDIATDLGLITIGHPPVERSLRAYCGVMLSRDPKPYLDRNKDIVREADLMIAAPGEREPQLRSGTWSTIRFARKMRKRLWIFYPDGSHHTEDPADFPVATL